MNSSSTVFARIRSRLSFAAQLSITMLLMSGCSMTGDITSLVGIVDSSTTHAISVALTSTNISDVVTASFNVTATFSEPVTGMTATQVSTTNASLSNFTGSGAVYNFDITPTAEGLATVTILPSGIKNSSGDNLSAAIGSLSKYYDLNPVTLNFSKLSSVLPEGNTATTATLTLSATKPYPITIALDVFGSAQAGVDHDLTLKTVTIPAYSTSATFSFNLLENVLAQPERNLSMSVTSASSPKVKLGTMPVFALEIQDNDSTPYTTVVDVAMGYQHTCARLNTGAIKCWGGNSYGSLGIGSTTSVTTPTIVSPGTNFTSLTAGSHSSCAITNGNTVKCWGYNGYGELGDGTYTQRTSPITVDSGVSYKKVNLGGSENGGYTTCGITSTDDLKCWGDNNYGQFGDGTTNPSLTPVAVHAGTKYKDLSIGGLFACAITSTDSLQCWGTNWNGELGDGTYNDSTVPLNIDVGTTYAVVSAGGYHACAITKTGILKCWGYGAALGTGDTNDRLTPAIIDPGTSYSWISAGEMGACGVTTAGVLKCWGKNNFGQIGSPDVLVSSTANQKTPLVIDPGTLYSKVSMQKSWAGGSSIIHTCGITVGGSLNCWGDNSYGQLSIVDYSLLPQASVLSQNFTKISADQSVYCGLDATGSVYCWGTNTNKALQDPEPAIVLLRPYLMKTSAPYSSLSVGANTVCGITTGNKLECWGSNISGQLADGTTTDRTTAQIIDPTTSYSMVSTSATICAITTAGVLKCWGHNLSGQIGDGTTVDKKTPVIIDSGVSYKYVSTGGMTTCAITTAGVLKCWGYNTIGAIGNGTTINSSSPVIVDSGTIYASVQTTGANTCALTPAGALKCWGVNFNGSVGDGTTTTRTSPVAIAGTYLKIGMRSVVTCAITNTNALKCWGRNYKGAVGDGTTVLNKTSPVTIDSGVSYTEILPSASGSCGITTSGILKCWGNDTGLSGINKTVPNYINNLQI